MTQPPNIAIFTDLDGTLLDHDSYDWTPAKPLLGALIQQGIPVVLTSSKTAVELFPLRAAMGLGGSPAICENGAGVLAAHETQPPVREAYHRIRAALTTVSPDLRQDFEGFGDMSTARIAEVTGLSETEACSAAERAFSEPGLWHGADEGREILLAQLATAGITGQQGGRFLTLGFGRTKADAMRQVADNLGADTTIALGDAPNDLEMLNAADHAIVVPNPHAIALPPLRDETTGRVIRAELPGPRGWSAGLKQVLSGLGIETEGGSRG